MNFKRKICFALYLLAKALPNNESRVKCFQREIRGFLVRRFATSVGSNINIQRNATISPTLVIGHNSGIGANSIIGRGTVIGDNVMMGQNVTSIRAIMLSHAPIFPCENKACKTLSP